MRTFNLNDMSSGTPDTVAEGVEFSDGQIFTHWRVPMEKSIIFRTINEVPNSYEYGNLTLEWLDV